MMSHRIANRRVTLNQGTVNEVTIVRCTIDVPVKVYDAYAERALPQGQDAEDMMVARLTATAKHAPGGIYFDPQQKRRLDNACGHVVSDTEGALQHLENLNKVKVADVTVEIEPRLKQRLLTRVFRGQTYEGNVKKVVTHALRVFAGLEPQ